MTALWIYLIGCLLSTILALITFKIDHNRGHDFTINDLIGYGIAIILSYIGFVAFAVFIVDHFEDYGKKVVLIKGKGK